MPRYTILLAMAALLAILQPPVLAYAAGAPGVPETSVGQCGVYMCIRYRVVVGGVLDAVEWVAGVVVSTNGTLFEERLFFASLGGGSPPLLARNSSIVFAGGNYSYTVLSDRVVASRLVASRIAGLLGSVGYFTIVRDGDDASDIYLLYNIRVTSYSAAAWSSGNVSASVIAVSGYGRVMLAGVVGEVLEQAGVKELLPLEPLYVLDSVAAPSASTVVVLIAYGRGSATMYLEAVYAYPPGLGETVLNHFAEASQGVVTGSMPSYTVVVLYPELRSLLQLLSSHGVDVERGLEALDRGLLAQFLAWRSTVCGALVRDQYAYAALLAACLVEPLDPYATIFMLDYSLYTKNYLRSMPDPAALALIPDLVKVVRSLDSGYGLLVVFKPREGLQIETVTQRVLAYMLAHGAVLLAPAGYMQLDPPIPVEGLEPDPKSMLTTPARLLLEALIEGRLPPGLTEAAASAVSSPQQVLESITAANASTVAEDDLKPPTTPRYQPAVPDGSIEDDGGFIPFGYENGQSRPIVVEWPEYVVDMERVRRIMEALVELEETLRGQGLEDYRVPPASITPEPLSLRVDPLAAAGAVAAPVLALTWRYTSRLLLAAASMAQGLLARGDPVRCYRAAAGLLAAAGHPRMPWEGPMEHCERLPPRVRGVFESVVKAYVESRYAGRGAAVDCPRTMSRLLRAVLGRRGGGG